MKPGDWVRFWTKNWPDDVTAIGFSVDTAAESEDGPGQGLYMGRGRIIRVRETGAVLVRGIEEESGDLAEGYIPPEEREPGETWFFFISITLNGQRAHDALRGENHE